jgi:hypothetical protein
MSVACVVATSALAPFADSLNSSGGVPYSHRAWLLRNVILPTYRWAGIFSEVVIVGEWEPGPGYTHVPFDSVYRNCADALLKRQVGFDALKDKSVEWVLFQHDDHLYDPTNAYPVGDCEVVAPGRYTHARSTGDEKLNDGSAYGYVNGHACLMRPECFTDLGFRWDTLPPVFTWDIEMTKRLDRLGLTWAYRPSLRIYDLERGAAPWR